MKKILLAIAGVSLLGMVSCGGNEKATENTEVVATDSVSANTGATEQVQIDPYIAKLMQNDSTIKVTASGLGYKVIKEGNGSRPNRSNTASVKYTGKHKDGTEFDSSKGNTVDFPLSQVVPGFTEGISLMPTGSVYELYIPGHLGYGERGVPQAGIQPNELLIFEVELVDFK